MIIYEDEDILVDKVNSGKYSLVDYHIHSERRRVAYEEYCKFHGLKMNKQSALEFCRVDAEEFENALERGDA